MLVLKKNAIHGCVKDVDVHNCLHKSLVAKHWGFIHDLPSQMPKNH